MGKVTVTVRLFAVLRERAGNDLIEVLIPSTSTYDEQERR